MPELPEVETLCRQLDKEICGKIIIKNEVFDKKLTSIRNIQGRKIIAVGRWGKTIAIMIDDGRTILIHLRMTGRLLWQTNPEIPKYARWKIKMDGGEVFLVDPRRFA